MQLPFGSGPLSSPPLIPGNDKVSTEAAKEASKLLKAFGQANETRFQFENIIAEGSAGVTLKFKMTDGDSGPSLLKKRKIKRFVMKRALNAQAERNLTQEIRVLQRFKASIHVARPFAIHPDSPDNQLPYLRGPTLFMEWIEGGLLWDFVDRVGEWGRPLPNRMLWRLFLCCCRFLIAMAWPPAGDGDDPLSVEAIPPPNAAGQRPEMSRLVHGDLNSRNVMIDDFEPLEHNRVPLLKLIDFGGSRDLPEGNNQPPDLPIKTNMLYVGQLMLNIIGGSPRGGTIDMKVTIKGQDRMIKSCARDLDGLNPAYKAPQSLVSRHKEKMNNLDPEIRNLVVQCCALKPSDRPDIEHLVSAVEKAVKTKQQSDYTGYKYQSNESDAAVERISKELLLSQCPLSLSLESLSL